VATRLEPITELGESWRVVGSCLRDPCDVWSALEGDPPSSSPLDAGTCWTCVQRSAPAKEVCLCNVPDATTRLRRLLKGSRTPWEEVYPWTPCFLYP
jgi:hypothetical protein